MDSITLNAFDVSSAYTGEFVYDLDLNLFNKMLGGDPAPKPTTQPEERPTGRPIPVPRRRVRPRPAEDQLEEPLEELVKDPIGGPRGEQVEEPVEEPVEPEHPRRIPIPRNRSTRHRFLSADSSPPSHDGAVFDFRDRPTVFQKRGRPVRDMGPVRVSYDISTDVDRLMHNLQSMVKESRAVKVSEKDVDSCHEACERKYVGALMTVSSALRTLMVMVPDIKRIDHPQIKLLVNASRNDFVNVCLTESQKQRSLGVTNVYIDGTDQPLTVNLGLDRNDRLKSTLYKMAQLWKYETKMWERFSAAAKGGYDMKDLIEARRLRVERPFEQTSQLVDYLLDSIDDLTITGVERAKLSDWFTLISRYLKLDHQLLVNELTEGYILKEENKVLKERLDSLQVQVRKLQNRDLLDKWK
ncbi:ORF66 [Ictalurid herpesvirus 1]|uniref:Uncharacterized protein ORF66 n=1 Tax=Ictalurid herpesvirus 1 (strain Auburn) TaxID=766178 RepID=VG66_ICHVA|nr:ORF66 [Ictalurid herpesvirus 1]Q00154.1 RecName: Full=Uncharacterized protein ORF66 [Ictalurid herpesvirus 1 (strain Auburn)]AAA88170.1 ORF66 [Ictalurid herpesvirus 1]